MDLKRLFGDLLEEIFLWKDRYGDVFYVEIGKNKYIFRILLRGEYLKIRDLQDHGLMDISDVLLGMCLLYPKYDKREFDNRLAGEIDYVVRNIIELSGFSKTDGMLEDIEEERRKIESLDNQILLLICKAFPHLTPQDLDKMNYNSILRYLTLAEAILDVKLSIDKSQNQNKIDFEKDNVKLKGGKTPPLKKHKRGDIG